MAPVRDTVTEALFASVADDAGIDPFAAPVPVMTAASAVAFEAGDLEPPTDLPTDVPPDLPPDMVYSPAPPLAARAGRDDRTATPGPDRGDPAPGRIPVLDLDRLRSWLTLGDVNLGRLAIVSVEIDNLEFVEERLGYAAGEHLIEAITQRLRTVTRPRATSSRTSTVSGSCSCAATSPTARPREGLAERIAMGVAHPSVVLAGVAEVTASIGVALAGHLDERPESVLRRAIKAGNQAKAQRRCAHRDQRHADVDVVRRRRADAARSRATSCASTTCRSSAARPAGSPASRRWCAGSTPSTGSLLPGEFLPEAELNGTIVPLGTWSVEHACRQMAAWQGQAGATLKLNLNLSARQFAEPTLPAQVKRIIGETGLAPGAVWLEITETTLFARPRRQRADAWRRLHELGVRLVIDDFGTGASSLVSLKHFPLDAIKIASTFVGDLGRDRDSDAICSAIVELAHSLGLCAIAEGVETLEQFAAFRALDCELAQGHLFGPARPAEDYGAAPAATLGVVGTSDGVTPPV